VNEDKATRYHRLNRRATLLWTAAGGAVLAGLLYGGGSGFVRDMATAVTAAGPSAPSTVALYALVLVLGYQALRLPLAFYQGVVLERRYGLSSDSLSAWVRDYLRAAALIVSLAVGAAEVVYLTLRWWPQWWWVPSAACFIAALVILARVAPVALLPLFYRFEPLERESLRARLVSLSERARVPVLGIYVWGVGGKTRRANAVLVGTGATRRILVSDTLLAGYSHDEIDVILAHEIGHHVHGDIRQGLLIDSGLLVLSFGVGALARGSLWDRFSLSGPADVAGLPLLFLAGLAVSLASAPAMNAWSRRNERSADRYALSLTGRPDAFVSAMRRLAAQNLVEARPSRTAVWLFHTHPPIDERMEIARKYRGSAVSGP
jgi:STE24 endopeptidase